MTIHLQETIASERPLVPEHTALLIVGMGDRMAGIDRPRQPGELAVLDRINQLAADCRAAGVTVMLAESHGKLHCADVQGLLHTRGIDSVILAGISAEPPSDIALQAASLSWRIFVLSDGTITSAPPDSAVHPAPSDTDAGPITAGTLVLTVDRMTQTILRGLRSGDRHAGRHRRHDIPKPRERRSRMMERLAPDHVHW